MLAPVFPILRRAKPVSDFPSGEEEGPVLPVLSVCVVFGPYLLVPTYLPPMPNPMGGCGKAEGADPDGVDGAGRQNRRCVCRPERNPSIPFPARYRLPVNAKGQVRSVGKEDLVCSTNPPSAGLMGTQPPFGGILVANRRPGTMLSQTEE